MTTKFNERMANIKRKAYRRDPVANALLEVLPLAQIYASAHGNAEAHGIDTPTEAT